MAAKRKNQRKTDPEQVSGISAAAIEGATDGDNAEKMARPGPGLPDRRVGRRRVESDPVESTRRESTDSDEFDELGGA
jgi:hypothetical protein